MARQHGRSRNQRGCGQTAVGYELRVEKQHRTMWKLAVWSVGLEEVGARWSTVIPVEDYGGRRSACVGHHSRRLELEVAATRRGGEGEPIPRLGWRRGGHSCVTHRKQGGGR
jgi:hypothetical protein